MFLYCKLCGECLLLDRHISATDSLPKADVFKCRLCEEYHLLRSLGKVESETISYKDWFLTFFPALEEGNIGVKKGMSWKRVDKAPIKELTHELAIQWVNKLKTYCIFE